MSRGLASNPRISPWQERGRAFPAVLGVALADFRDISPWPGFVGRRALGIGRLGRGLPWGFCGFLLVFLGAFLPFVNFDHVFISLGVCFYERKQKKKRER